MTLRGQRVCIPITIPNQTMQAYAVLELLGFTFQNIPEGTPSSSSSPESVIQDALHPFQIFSDSPTSCEIAQAFTELKSSRLNKANSLITGGERKFASQIRMSPRKSLSPKESNHAGSAVKENSKHHQIHAATTFVQADSSSFRELVQQLTGAGETSQDKLSATLLTKSAARESGLIREEFKGGTFARRREAGGGEIQLELGSAAKLREGRQSSKGLEIRRDTNNFKRKDLSSLLAGISVLDIQPLLSIPKVMSSLNDVFQTIHFPSPSSEQEIDPEGNHNLESISAESSPVMEECSSYAQVEMQSKSDLKLLPLFPVHS
ncbi:hypothetical protein O6H91_07G006200 [Diphasiastrum complanatum]|uniref:Uncharacterized protein n=1 Tax=Diphasiastrum complanatum TaxID=34168 RepID=A0ACC2D2G1_DIPCM|nr:hypothetical protein O6H91_07G006200 [Diphasiastrum complanatum]